MGGATCWGLPPFLCSSTSHNNLSARSAAVAADMHVAIKFAFLVATTDAVLALETCDLGVEQWQPH